MCPSDSYEQPRHQVGFYTARHSRPRWPVPTYSPESWMMRGGRLDPSTCNMVLSGRNPQKTTKRKRNFVRHFGGGHRRGTQAIGVPTVVEPKGSEQRGIGVYRTTATLGSIPNPAWPIGRPYRILRWRPRQASSFMGGACAQGTQPAPAMRT